MSSNAETEVLNLVERVWGTRSPDLDSWAEKSDTELEELKDDLDLSIDDWKRFFIAVEAATRARLDHWDDLPGKHRKKVYQVLSDADEVLEDGEYLL